MRIDRPPKIAGALLALVTGAIVANINLSIANVALPFIGADLQMDQGHLAIIASSAAFTGGKSWAILIVLVLTILGLLLVWFLFPGKAAEEGYYESVLTKAPATPSS